MICAHCECEFVPTASQHKHRHSRQACCSKACRDARSGPPRKDRPVYGPCPTCGVMFTSRIPKVFCTIGCYTTSPGFKERLAANAKKGSASRVARLAAIAAAAGKPHAEGVERVVVACRECSAEMSLTPVQAQKRRYCSANCYRGYMAKRFDRWIASPEGIALPQAYDEFLMQGELSCLVQGCDWRGHALSNHMNFTHGVTADEFKRAAGFNLKTGVVSPSMRDSLTSRPSRPELMRSLIASRGDRRETTAVIKYRSLEGREHSCKARALCIEETPPPERVCRGCGALFQQSTPFGRAVYCTRECRAEFYAREKDSPTIVVCGICSNVFNASGHQRRQHARGRPVFCGVKCRQINNSTTPAARAYHQRRHKASGPP